MDTQRILSTLQQVLFTLKKIRPGVEYLYKHRLWEGFWSYGWVVRFLVVAGLLVSFRMLQIVYHGLQRLRVDDPKAALSSVGAAMSTVAEEGSQFLYNGSMKYILMIFMEIIIFHVCRKAIAQLTGNDSETSFTAFIQAQKRMFEVVLRVFILEMIFTGLVKVAFWILGPVDFLQPAVLFLIQSYFLGFTVLDNYHEQFGLTIKESFAYGKQFIGVSLGLGMFLQVLFYLPLFGAVAGPLIAAVVVSLVMYELSDLHKQREQVGLVLNRSEDIV